MPDRSGAEPGPIGSDVEPAAPGPPPPPGWRQIVLALALPLIAVAAIVVGARTAGGSGSVGPLAVATVDAPGAASTACGDLLSALPDKIGDAQRRDLAGPADGTAGVAAWGDPAVILRCGIGTPAELTCSAALQGVDTVDWVQISGTGQTTYVVADRPVRVALTVPDGAGTAAIQEISRVIAGVLPEHGVCADGVLVPVTGG